MAELNSRPKNKGFSLVELIIAVGILAAGITIIMQAFSFSARATGLFCDMINAVFLAEDKMQEWEFKETHKLVSKEPPEGENKKDKFEYKYALNFDPGLNLYKLDFSVNWQRLSRKKKIDINTYLR